MSGAEPGANEPVGGPATGLTVVVPAYNAGAALAATVADLCANLSGALQVVVVDDGSTDGSADALVDAAGVEVVRLGANAGKGAALRAGFGRARHPVVAMVDADGAYRGADVARLAGLLVPGVAVVAGSRAVGGAGRAANRGRCLGSAAFRVWVRFVLGLRLLDTQAGLKVLRADVARQAAARCEEDGFGFDAELLVLVAEAGLGAVVEAPVVPVGTDRSTVTPRRALGAFVAVARIARRRRAGRYRLAGSARAAA